MLVDGKGTASMSSIRTLGVFHDGDARKPYCPTTCPCKLHVSSIAEGWQAVLDDGEFDLDVPRAAVPATAKSTSGSGGHSSA